MHVEVLRFSRNSEASASEFVENLGRNVSSMLVVANGSQTNDCIINVTTISCL